MKEFMCISGIVKNKASQEFGFTLQNFQLAQVLWMGVQIDNLKFYRDDHDALLRDNETKQLSNDDAKNTLKGIQVNFVFVTPLKNNLMSSICWDLFLD